MDLIRRCTPSDIPAVATIFQKMHRDHRRRRSAALEACLQEVLFDHPDFDPDLPSLVYLTPEGNIGGFIGVVPLIMSYCGNAVRAAVPTSLAVEDPHNSPHAGAMLLRSFLNGPQDISISEPANDLSVGMWQRLGGISVHSESMEWLCVFRPASLALALAAERFSPVLLGHPLAYLVDRVASKMMGNAIHLEAKKSRFAYDADVNGDAFLHAVHELAKTYVLHPQWEPQSFRWMLEHASQHTVRKPLFRRLIYDKNDVPIGCYLYQGSPHGMAWVLQVLASPENAGAVLDSLFAHAQSQGVAAIKGRTQLRLIDPLLRRRSIFYRRHSAVVHSRNPELLAAVKSGDAITSGFAAESWMRLIGDKFG